MAEQMCGVYKITNLLNGKIYVGSSNNIYYRWRQHKSQLRKHKHGNDYLQNAWSKYGEENFSFSIIEKCDPNIQFEREQYYLDTLNPFDENGYNIVRQISSEYGSDNYTTKKCKYCGKEFKTFSHLAKKCNECKSKDAEYWNDIKSWYIGNQKEEDAFNKLMTNIYGDVNYFYEITD